MFVIFRLATVRREKFVCSHSDIVTVGLQWRDINWCVMLISVDQQESRWKIEFGFEYFTGNHERRHLEEGISISFACTVYMY